MITQLISRLADSTPCPPSGFFGLRPWYFYIDDSKHFKGCDVVSFRFFPNAHNPSDIPLVLLAIIDDLLRVAGLIAVIFVIIGAIRFITSQGNPEDASKAQATVINALVGLAIAIVSVAFVTFLGHKLGS